MHEPVILIVEDVEQNRKILKKVVLKDFTQVLEAENGIEALRVLKEHGNVDLILLDLIMPGMDGIEFIRSLEYKDKDIPIIVLSATTEIKMAVDSLRLGARDYLEKPYNKELILRRVRELLSERQSIQESNILFVGEQFSYGELQKAFETKSEIVYVCESFSEALSLLQGAKYSVVISDLSNNKHTIKEFLKEVRKKFPDIIHVVTAKEEDKVMVYDLVDEGLVRDMVLDPIDMSELSMTVMNGIIYSLESCEVRKYRQQLGLLNKG